MTRNEKIDYIITVSNHLDDNDYQELQELTDDLERMSDSELDEHCLESQYHRTATLDADHRNDFDGHFDHIQ